MIYYAVYDIETGLIKRRVCREPTSVISICNDGEEFYLNCPLDATHILNNEPVTVEPPPPSPERLLFAIRQQRDRILDQVDLKYCNAERWSAMTPEQQQAWRDYKQALRDLPATCDPDNPVWPPAPITP